MEDPQDPQNPRCSSWHYLKGCLECRIESDLGSNHLPLAGPSLKCLSHLIQRHQKYVHLIGDPRNPYCSSKHYLRRRQEKSGPRLNCRRLGHLDSRLRGKRFEPRRYHHDYLTLEGPFLPSPMVVSWPALNQVSLVPVNCVQTQLQECFLDQGCWTQYLAGLRSDLGCFC